MPYGSLVIKFAADLAELKTDVGKAASVISRDLNGALKATKFALAALGGVATVRSLINIAQASIDAQDAINKMSQSAGVGVEALSGLKYAADLSDVSFESLGTSLGKFNKAIAETQAGIGEAGDGFKALKISVEGSDKGLKSTDALLLEVAEKFAGMEDGAAKTAIAMKIFGKAGAEMIPFLNQGSTGIKNLRTEAAQLGVVLDAEAAAAAEQFNDDIKRMQTAVQGVVTQITIGMVPALDDMLNAFRSSSVEADKWRDVGKTIVDVFKDIVIAGLHVVSFLERIQNAVNGLASSGALLRQLKFAEALDIPAQIQAKNEKVNDELVKRIALIRAAGTQAGKAKLDLQSLTDIGLAPKVEKEKGRLVDSGAAKKAQAEQEKFAKAAEDLAISRAKILAANDQNLADQRLKILERFHSEGLIDETEYWQTRLSLQQDGIKAQIAAADQEVASAQNALSAAEKLRSVTTEGATKYLEALKNLEVAQDKRNDLDAKLGQIAVENNLDAAAATKRYEEQVRGLNAQLLELQGRSAEAAAIRFDDQVKDIERLAKGKPGDLALIADLRAATAAQAKFTQLSREAGLATGQLALEEERIRNSRDAGAISELRSLQQTGEARANALGQLQAMATEMDRVARESGQAFMIQQAKQFSLEVEKLAQQTDLLADKFDKIGETAFADFLTDVIEQTKSLKDAFKSMVDSIVKQINRLASEEIGMAIFGGISGKKGGGIGFGDLLSKIFSGAAGGGLGGGAAASAAGGFDVGQIAGMFLAEGGAARSGRPYVVGEEGPELFVPAVSGMVMPTGAGISGGKMTVVNQFTISGAVDKRSQQQVALAAGQGVNRALRRNG